MTKSFAAPRRIAKIAARRIFTLPNGAPVTLTLGVPQRVPGSDWGCALQITGLDRRWRRPRYVFGVDGLQALHLAMKVAGADLDSASLNLAWLGDTELPLMPKFLPHLPKQQQARLEAMVEREATKLGRSANRPVRATTAKSRSR